MNLTQKYDTWHRHMGRYEQVFPEPSQPWHVTAARSLPDLNGLHVLEIGCGRGDFAIWVARKYPQAVVNAVDFSDTAIDVARSRATDAAVMVRFAVENAESLSFPDHSFGFVISCECMEHVAHPFRMAREIYRVLRPGGGFILTTENYFNGMILAWLQSWVLGKPFNSGSGIQPRENFFVFWRVKKILRKSGLKVESMESNHFQWLLLPRTNPARLCTRDFNSAFFKRLFRPFGRHFTFCGKRPV
jgi:ubiquinone/menaquinone biosynthesis C-methylase UbiE